MTEPDRKSSDGTAKHGARQNSSAGKQRRAAKRGANVKAACPEIRQAGRDEMRDPPRRWDMVDEQTTHPSRPATRREIIDRATLARGNIMLSAGLICTSQPTQEDVMKPQPNTSNPTSPGKDTQRQGGQRGQQGKEGKQGSHQSSSHQPETARGGGHGSSDTSRSGHKGGRGS